MSIAAINWAFAANVKRSADKFVLVAMANRADAGGECFPSKAALEEATALDRKSIILALQRLCAAGLLVDTGARKGQTRQIVVYRLAMEVVQAEAEPVLNGHHKSPEIGPLSEIERVPNFPPKGPVFPTKGSQISHERVPKTGHGTLLEPSLNHQGTKYTPKPPSEIRERAGAGKLLNGHAQDFETWWKAYPRKVAKVAAATAYAKALDLTDPPILLQALDRRWPSEKYIPHPATWLNGQRWLDEDGGDPVLRAAGLDPFGRDFLPASDDLVPEADRIPAAMFTQLRIVR